MLWVRSCNVSHYTHGFVLEEASKNVIFMILLLSLKSSFLVLFRNKISTTDVMFDASVDLSTTLCFFSGGLLSFTDITISWLQQLGSSLFLIYDEKKVRWRNRCYCDTHYTSNGVISKLLRSCAIDIPTWCLDKWV